MAEEIFYSRLKPLGVFRELGHGSPAGASLRELVSATPQEDEEKIVAY